MVSPGDSTGRSRNGRVIHSPIVPDSIPQGVGGPTTFPDRGKLFHPSSKDLPPRPFRCAWPWWKSPSRRRCGPRSPNPNRRPSRSRPDRANWGPPRGSRTRRAPGRQGPSSGTGPPDRWPPDPLGAGPCRRVGPHGSLKRHSGRARRPRLFRAAVAGRGVGRGRGGAERWPGARGV